MKATLLLETSTATDAGVVRKLNEDSLGIREPSNPFERVQKGALWVIADGIGSGGRGQQASRLAVHSIVDAYWTSAIPEPLDRLRSAIERTNGLLFGQNDPRAPSQDITGATILAAVVVEGRLYIAHVGRSRAYVQRDGVLRQLTQDHTWVAEQVKIGQIAAQDAATHPRRNVITRCLGIKDAVRIDVLDADLAPGDIILFCSDGLHRQVPDTDIQRIIQSDRSGAAQRLVDEANRRGGEDNITTVVIQADFPSEQQDSTVDRLAVVNRIGRELAMSLDVNATLGSVMKQLIAMTGGERGAVLLRDEHGSLVPRAAHNLGPGTFEDYSRTVAAQALAERKPVVVANALDDPSLNNSMSIVGLSLRSIVCVPMILKENAIGVLYVDSAARSNVFDQTDIDLLVSFASLAATAIENARLHETLLVRSRELENSRARQESLFRSLSSGLIAIDNGGIVTHWNPAAADMLGVRPDVALGKRLAEILSTALASWIGNLAIQAELDSQTFMMSHEWEGPVDNRDRAIIAGRVARIRDIDGQAEGTVFILNDRTDVVLLEEARRTEGAERDRMRDLFRRYLAPSVAERLLNSPEAVQLGGSREDVTILFADVRGFSGFSERHTPEEVVAMLNHYLALATHEIFNELGTLDKFLGDGVMAIFGAPVPVPNHEMAAVRAALAMRASLDRLRNDTGVRVGFGIGLNAGAAVVGNIGTAQLMNYTAIGDVVNVAARLQSEARSGEILISQMVLERVKDAVVYEELSDI
ncbi:MAG: GAF domain-containing protein, partial [Chloroflexota bacterium]|nr:GAF domain-containing protein [Chloroflexota bacterium]